MSLSFIQGIPIGVIKSKGDINNELVYYDSASSDNIENFSLKGDDTITPIPFINLDQKQRSAIYISGVAGSGKSTIAAELAYQLEKIHNFKKKIVLITDTHDDDDAFEKLRENKKIEFITIHLDDAGFTELTWSNFSDAIVIADDFDSSSDVKLKKFTLNLIEGILKNCRKKNVDVIVISHLSQDYKNTKVIIFECNSYVLFPSSNRNACNRFLKSYLDFTDNQLLEVKKLKTRYIYINKSVPSYMMDTKTISLLN